MSVKVRDVVDALEHFAPLPLQESYDNAGLQCGLTETEVSGALLCLDVTEDVLREAIDLGCNMVVAHHPMLFHGLKRVSDGSMPERCLRLALHEDIAVYAAHTNLDNAEDGVNYMIAEKLGLVDVVSMQGGGVLGYLPVEEQPEFFLERVKETFRCTCLMHNDIISHPIGSVAVCGGAGDFALDEALRQETDAFLTGEMHYHRYFGLKDKIQIGVLGHYESEQYTTELLMRVLANALPTLPLYVTEVNTNPIKYLI